MFVFTCVFLPDLLQQFPNVCCACWAMFNALLQNKAIPNQLLPKGNGWSLECVVAAMLIEDALHTMQIFHFPVAKAL